MGCIVACCAFIPPERHGLRDLARAADTAGVFPAARAREAGFAPGANASFDTAALHEHRGGGGRRRAAVFTLPTALGTTIAALWLPPPLPPSYRASGGAVARGPAAAVRPDHFCVLFCHGNAEDLLHSSSWLRHLRDSLGAAVLAFEYSGYGASQPAISRGPRPPSEQHAYADINAAFAFARDDLGYSPARTILFGRSLGTGPTVDLAARLGDGDGPQQVGGIILQSPLTSAIATQLGPLARCLACWDLFCSARKAHRVACPRIFIVHGTRDGVIPCRHGRALHRMFNAQWRQRGLLDDCDGRPRCEAFWATGAGHNDIDVRHGNSYYAALRGFVERCVAAANRRRQGGGRDEEGVQQPDDDSGEIKIYVDDDA